MIVSRKTVTAQHASNIGWRVSASELLPRSVPGSVNVTRIKDLKAL